MGNNPNFIAIGKITGAHGIKGAVKIVSFAESDDIFAPGTQLRARMPSGEIKILTILSADPHAKTIRLTFREAVDRTQAEHLAGAELFIDRTTLPELEEGTYYWSDIIGISVFTTDGAYLGRIASILPTGSNDVYIVKHKEGDQEKEVLIPALASIVLEIDIEAKKMVVDPPEGLV